MNKSTVIKEFLSSNKAALIIKGSQCIHANMEAARLFGVKSTDCLINRHPCELSPQYQVNGLFSYSEAEKYLNECYETGRATLEWLHLNLSSNDIIKVDVELRAFIFRGQKYILVGLSNLGLDLSSYKATDSLLGEYKRAIDSSSIVSKANVHGEIIYINDNFCHVSGYSKSELLGKSHNIVKHPSVPDSFFSSMWKTLNQGKTWRGVIKNLKKNGETYYVDSTITPIKNSSGEIVEYIAIRNEITKLIKLKRAVSDLHTDQLTGLKNRNKLNDDLKDENLRYVAVLELEGLKDLQLLLSHDSYNDLVIKVTELIRRSLSKSERLYRFNEESFALTSNALTLDKFLTVIHRLIVSFENTDISSNDIELHLTPFFGIAENVCSTSTDASIALDYAKKHSQNISIFNSETNLKGKIRNAQIWANQLRSAVSNNLVVPFGQNIVDVDGHTVYTEVLMRIEQNNTYTSPVEFIDIAIKSQLYHKLSLSIIQKSAEFFAIRDEHFSLNLIKSDLENKDVMRELLSLLDTPNLASRLTIELVESELFNTDRIDLLETLKLLKSKGCKIAIDDFGSGFSNFSYLTEMPIDIVKIDGSLIKNLDKNKQIVIAINNLCKSIGAKVVAEFVENETQFNQLKDIGINYFQGYLFDQPKLLH